MNHRAIVFVSALLMGLSACVTQAADVPQRSGYTFRTEVRTAPSEFDEGVMVYDTIAVYATDAKGRTQVLYTVAQPLEVEGWSKEAFGYVTEDDWNFDGIPDLQVCCGPSNAQGNSTFECWLWNEAAHKFVLLEQPVCIYEPSLDSANKLIVSVFRLDGEVEIVRYKWQGGKLVEHNRESFNENELTDD